MTWKVVWTRRATKELLSIEPRQRLIIAKWISSELGGCENPFALPNAKKLQAVENGWRWRVGTYRILGRADKDKLVIDIMRVGHRRDVYRHL